MNQLALCVLRQMQLAVDSERLSSRSSFQLEDEFLDTSEP